MPGKRVYICAWLKPEEKKEVLALACQTHLTTSELIRRLVLGRKLPDVRRYESVLSMLRDILKPDSSHVT